MSMLTSNTGAFIESQQYGKKKRKKPLWLAAKNTTTKKLKLQSKGKNKNGKRKV